MQETECVCPGHTVTFQCTVVGIGSTVWQGSAFHCSESDGSLTLRHQQFANGTLLKYCDGANVVAHAIGVIGNSHLSQLNLTVSNEVNNKTVECVQDTGTEVIIIGTTAVSVTTGTHACSISLKDHHSSLSGF